MKSLLSALQFLTIIPVKLKTVTEKQIARAMMYFPVVGLLLGLLLYGLYLLLSLFELPEFAIDTMVVIALIAFTGGMHLDGLADTADAFLSIKPKEEKLAIMRDSHIGAMGVIAITSVMLLKIALVFSLPLGSTMAALILMCALSRWSAVFLMFFFSYAREEGKAKVFIKENSLLILSVSTCLSFIIAFFTWQIKGIVLLAAVAGLAFLAGKVSERKLGGITGDTIGAFIEISELMVLFAFCIA